MWLYNARMYYRRCSSHAAGTLYHRRHPCGRDLPSRCHNHARNGDAIATIHVRSIARSNKGKLLRTGLEQFSCALSSQQRTVRAGSQIGEFLLEKVGTGCKCMRVYAYMYVCITRKRERKRDTRETCMHTYVLTALKESIESNTESDIEININ